MESTKGVEGRAKMEEIGGKATEERGSAKLQSTEYGSAGAEDIAKNERNVALV